jgi:hypothetical protein
MSQPDNVNNDFLKHQFLKRLIAILREAHAEESTQGLTRDQVIKCF